MKRAALLIGVHKCADMPKLFAVLDCVGEMKKWARMQGMLVRTITDRDGRVVTSSDIETAVVDLLKTDGLRQLIIYFAGHGVNINYNEYWLLSRAVHLPAQSVNLRGSMDRARYCGLKHLIIISDACRTAPRSMILQGGSGRCVFPNPAPGSNKTDIDVFYATRLGEPALEINAKNAANQFRAVYTDSMLCALNGFHKSLLEVDERLGVKVVRPRPLSEYLEQDVPKRVYQSTNSFQATQVPESIISSDPRTSWISDVSKIIHREPSPTFSDSPASIQVAATIHAMRVGHARLIDGLISQDGLDLDVELQSLETENHGTAPISSPLEEFAKDTRLYRETFGPQDARSECQIRVRGDAVVEVVSSGDFEILNAGEIVEVNSLTKPTSTLLVFRSGRGVLIPTLPTFIASLTLQDTDSQPRLNDLSFEPSRNSRRWASFEEKQTEIRNLRAVVATSTKHGVFRLKDHESAARLARRMQLAKGIDLSLSLYAAHAFAELGLDDRLRRMSGFLRRDLGAVPLDIALLARELHDTNTSDVNSVVPFLPLLSQTWASLSAFNVSLPPGLEDISQNLVPGSLWSLYQPAGVRLIRNAMN